MVRCKGSVCQDLAAIIMRGHCLWGSTLGSVFMLRTPRNDEGELLFDASGAAQESAVLLHPSGAAFGVVAAGFAVAQEVFAGGAFVAHFFAFQKFH